MSLVLGGATVLSAGEGILLSEFLPAPFRVDWDGDGVASHLDEWIELCNTSGSPCDLGGWVLEVVSLSSTSAYTLPPGTVISPSGYHVFYRCETGLAMPNTQGEVRLRRAPGGAIVDRYAYGLTMYDHSWSRAPGGANWLPNCPPTPGQPNMTRYLCHLPLVLGSFPSAAGSAPTEPAQWR